MESIGNWFDLIFAATILVVALLTFLTGFVNAFLWVLKITIATILTYIISSPIVNILTAGEGSLITDLITQTVVFVILWIILSIIASRIKKILDGKVPKSVDQSLGFALGFAEAFLVISFIFSCVTTIQSNELFLRLTQGEKPENGRGGPKWLQESKSYKLLEIGADFTQPLTEIAIGSVKEIAGIQQNKDKALDDLKKLQKYNTIGNFSDKYEKRLEPKIEIKVEEREKDQGYKQREIDKKNHLIDITD